MGIESSEGEKEIVQGGEGCAGKTYAGLGRGREGSETASVQKGA